MPKINPSSSNSKSQSQPKRIGNSSKFRLNGKLYKVEIANCDKKNALYEKMATSLLQGAAQQTLLTEEKGTCTTFDFAKEKIQQKTASNNQISVESTKISEFFKEIVNIEIDSKHKLNFVAALNTFKKSSSKQDKQTPTINSTTDDSEDEISSSEDKDTNATKTNPTNDDKKPNENINPPINHPNDSSKKKDKKKKKKTDVDSNAEISDKDDSSVKKSSGSQKPIKNDPNISFKVTVDPTLKTKEEKSPIQKAIEELENDDNDKDLSVETMKTCLEDIYSKETAAGRACTAKVLPKGEQFPKSDKKDINNYYAIAKQNENGEWMGFVIDKAKRAIYVYNPTNSPLLSRGNQSIQGLTSLLNKNLLPDGFEIFKDSWKLTNLRILLNESGQNPFDSQNNKSGVTVLTAIKDLIYLLNVHDKADLKDKDGHPQTLILNANQGKMDDLKLKIIDSLKTEQPSNEAEPLPKSLDEVQKHLGSIHGIFVVGASSAKKEFLININIEQISLKSS